jgi:hypothetical protein
MSQPKAKPPCVYCAVAAGSTKDHLIARKYVPISDRVGMPIVPSCKTCNEEKSRLEQQVYPRLVWGRQNRTQDDSDFPVEVIKKIMRGNQKLAGSISSNLNKKLIAADYYNLKYDASLGWDFSELKELSILIAKGLFFLSTNDVVDPTRTNEVKFCTQSEEDVFLRMLNLEQQGVPTSRKRVVEAWGNQTFSHESYFAVEPDRSSYCFLSFYGGVPTRGNGVELSSRFMVILGA